MGLVKKLITGAALLATGAVAASSVYARKHNAELEAKASSADSKEEVENTLGFSFKEPSKMLENLQKVGYRIYPDYTLAEVRYEGEDEKGLTLRVSKVLSKEELNNDYHLYAQEKDVYVNDTLVHLLGNDDSVSNILFDKDGVAYTMVSELPMSVEVAQEIVRSF